MLALTRKPFAIRPRCTSTTGSVGLLLKTRCLQPLRAVRRRFACSPLLQLQGPRAPRDATCGSDESQIPAWPASCVLMAAGHHLAIASILFTDFQLPYA